MSFKSDDSPELPKRNKSKQLQPMSASVNPTSEKMKQKQMEMDLSGINLSKERHNSTRTAKLADKGKSSTNDNN